jgi:hypothetical protein
MSIIAGKLKEKKMVKGKALLVTFSMLLMFCITNLSAQDNGAETAIINPTFLLNYGFANSFVRSNAYAVLWLKDSGELLLVNIGNQASMAESIQEFTGNLTTVNSNSAGADEKEKAQRYLSNYTAYYAEAYLKMPDNTPVFTVDNRIKVTNALDVVQMFGLCLFSGAAQFDENYVALGSTIAILNDGAYKTFKEKWAAFE